MCLSLVHKCTRRGRVLETQTDDGFLLQPGLVDFAWIFIFATSTFGNMQLKLWLCEEKRLLLWAVPSKTTRHASHSILHSLTSRVRAFRQGASEDSLLLGSC